MRHYVKWLNNILLSHVAYRYNQFIAITPCEPFYIIKYILFSDVSGLIVLQTSKEINSFLPLNQSCFGCKIRESKKVLLYSVDQKHAKNVVLYAKNSNNMQI